MSPEPSCHSAECSQGQLSVCILGSGSRGNAIHVSDGTTSILVDAGFSAREIDRRLRSRGLDPEHLSAILLTHEHGDHVRGVERLVRRHRLPVYLTAGTRQEAAGLRTLPEILPFACGCEFRINTLTVRPFSISHDARDPAGFTIGANGSRIGIATDLGHVTALVREHLRGCRMLIVEANHDPNMLMEGPYPWFLKQRIRSRTGHLSNQEAGRLLAEILDADLEQVVLAHLSETNNTPAAALAEIASVLAGTPIGLSAASQNLPSPVWRIRGTESPSAPENG
jgi:phosphoribosyl 1,2-cyclic phosphodiesterase